MYAKFASHKKNTQDIGKDRSPYEPSFQLHVSPIHSHHQYEQLSNRSSLPSSPKSHIKFSVPNFDMSTQNIEKQLLLSRHKHGDMSFDASDKETPTTANRQVPIVPDYDIESPLDKRQSLNCKKQFYSFLHEKKRFETKDISKTIEKKINRLKLFWKGTSIHYPFTFKKVFLNTNAKGQSDGMLIRKEDFSKKIINFNEHFIGSS